jgi:hypothetical protein
VKLLDAVMLDAQTRARGALGASSREALRVEAKRANDACNAGETLLAMGQDENAELRANEAITASIAMLDAVAYDRDLRATLASATTTRTKLDAASDALRFVAQRWAEPGGPAKERVYRLGALLAGIAITLAIAGKLAPNPITVTASTQFYDDWPERAIDGDVTTNWSTEEPGAIELRFRRARPLAAVALYFPSQERTPSVTLTAFDGRAEIAHATLPRADSGWNVATLHAEHCTRLRVEITTPNGRGFALGEIEPR